MRWRRPTIGYTCRTAERTKDLVGQLEDRHKWNEMGRHDKNSFRNERLQVSKNKSGRTDLGVSSKISL